MQSMDEYVDREYQDLERRITALERYAGMLQKSALGTGGGSIQVSRLEDILASLKKELIGRELVIVGVEQTQAIQYFSINGQGSGYAPDNSVPLIAQRALVLRVYVNDRRDRRGGPLFPKQVTGQVTVYRVHTYGPVTHIATLSPINGPIQARSSASIDRGNPNHTLNFRLSPAQCQGHLRFRVTIGEQPAVFTEGASMAAESSTSANSSNARSIAFVPPDSAIEADDWVVSPEGPSPTMVVHGRFEKVPAFRVRAILIHYTGGGMDLPAPSGLDFAKTLNYVLGTYPIGRLEFSECMEMEYDGDLSAPGGGCMGWEALVNLLMAMQPSEDKAIYVALVPKGAFSPSVLGCGNRGVAAAKDGDGDTLAQEIGHAFGRKHAPGRLGADPDFPSYPGYPQASIGEFGFDTRSSRVYNPALSRDFMGSPNSNSWISPYTYIALRDAMVERFDDDSTAAAGQAASARRETLFLHFRVNRDGTVHEVFGFHLATDVNPNRRADLSEVSCELLDEAGNVLAFHRCHLTARHQDPDGPSVLFHEAIPWADRATTIRFLDKKKVLHIHEIEKSGPKVVIESPEIRCDGETIPLKWTGSHPDTETQLTYLIRYSNDGGETWQVVAANLRDAAYEPKLRQMPGGKQCLLQVVASSGIRTSVAHTDTFSSALKPRTAFILSPERNTDVLASGHTVLRGGAFSPDFGVGDLEDAVWCSNLDGPLGQGIELVADNLSSGYHTISLTVPDGVGGVATASVSVRVSGG